MSEFLESRLNDGWNCSCNRSWLSGLVPIDSGKVIKELDGSTSIWMKVEQLRQLDAVPLGQATLLVQLILAEQVEQEQAEQRQVEDVVPLYLRQ